MLFASMSPAGFRRHLLAAAPHPNTSFMAYKPTSPQQHPATLTQDAQSFTLSFDVPGVSREQLEVGIEGRMVRLSSASGAPRPYRFACELPQDIDATQSNAKLENGVLTLKLTKKVPTRQTTELVIH